MKPDIKKYLDIFQYLQDIYQFRKTLNGHFSYAVWSKELGIRNKAYLRLMVIGRRSINEKMMSKMIENIELNKQDTDFFVALLGYSQCKNLAEKKLLASRMMSLVRQDFAQEEVEMHMDFLSDPLLPKLHSLLSFDDIAKSPENLARLLGTEESEIAEALSKLEKFQLIEMGPQGIRPKNPNFKVPDKFKDLGLKSFYLNLFDEAKKAMNLPGDLRRFRSLFFAANEEEVKYLTVRLDEIAKDLLSRHDFSELADRRLYQIHFNFFPLSEAQEVQPIPCSAKMELTEH
jgi:uncharacterized protein (TIGR02147 family)